MKGNQPAENASQIKYSRHNEVIKCYCNACHEGRCNRSTTHELTCVEQNTSEAKTDVQNLIKDVEKKVETISTGIKAMKTTSQEITQRNEACKSQIEKFFTQLHAEIDAQKKIKLAEAENAAESQKNEVEDLQKNLELSLSSCQSSVHFAKLTLANVDDVQFLHLKSFISCQLGKLTSVQDKITPNLGNPVRFLKGKVLNGLCQKLATDSFFVEEVAVCPAKCQAKLSEPIVKVGQKSEINITYKDNQDRIISSAGVGKDLIKPVIVGVKVQNLLVTENEDGRHVISFVPDELGTLQFHATINGCVSPGCSLKADVQWELSDAHGSGYLRADRQLLLRNSMSGKGDVGMYSFRLGNTPMSRGIDSVLLYPM